MDNSDLPKNLNTFLEEYLENIGDNSKEIRRDLELIQELDEVYIKYSNYLQKYTSLLTEIEKLKTTLLDEAENRVKNSSSFENYIL